MKYTASFKLWHWLNALVVLGLLGTVFLRKTFLSYKANAEILMQKLSEIDIVITIEQAKVLAKAIRAPMWDWHIFLGYALAFLMLWRIVLYFGGAVKKEKFSTLSAHKKAVQLLYYLLYATLFFMSISGLVIYFYEALSLSKEFAHTLKELHESAFNIILVFVVLHIAGLTIAENHGEKGVISDMLNAKA
ncbi:MAG: cytochrome b/b6 domain-containing protein [Sulfurimonas sp.]|nr:cytochrome b/b6 domain-containing protein [Sulfurimonas sp.]MDD3061081.1 cytochrome b/b6 domain-containing protein [Sulfurimonas sp.]